MDSKEFQLTSIVKHLKVYFPLNIVDATDFLMWQASAMRMKKPGEALLIAGYRLLRKQRVVHSLHRYAMQAEHKARKIEEDEA